MIEALTEFMDILAMAIGYSAMMMAFAAGLVYFSHKSLLWALRLN
jgi:hypothetical protein